MLISRRDFVKTVVSAIGVSPFISSPILLNAKSFPEDPLQTIASALLRSPREKVLDTAFAFLEGGADWRQLLGAVLLAGSQEVRPEPVGFKVHGLMVVGSAYQLAEAMRPEQRLIPTLFCVDGLKSSQQQDIGEGDWTLSAAAESKFSDVREARLAFVAAMDDWNLKEADRAMIGLFHYLDRDAIFELLWPYAARDFGDIGHKAIFTAQAHYALGYIPWQSALPILRNLTYGLLSDKKNSEFSDFGKNIARVEELDLNWMNGKRALEASHQFMKQLRTVDSSQAGELAAGMLAEGVHPQSIWDGARLFASEALFRSPGFLAVHATTSVNALHMAYMRTSNRKTKALCLLQAASWMPLMRQFLSRSRLYSLSGPGLDSLKPEKSAKIDLKAIFTKAETNHAEAGSMMLTLLKEPGSVSAIKNQMRELLMDKCRENHQFKYLAAMHMDFDAAAPGAASHIMAAGLGFLPNIQTEETRISRLIKARLNM